jgi:hypothetical protein
MGRSLKGWGSQKTCLKNWENLRGLRLPKDLEDKKGKSPDRSNRSGDFFSPGLEPILISGEEVE